MLRTLLILSLLIVAAGVGWFVRGWASASATSTEAEANVCRVVRGRIEHSVKARGIVKPGPHALIRLGFPPAKNQARRIGRLSVVEGDEVKAGEVLAEVDHEDLKATLDKLQSDWKVTQRRLEALKVLEPAETRVAEAMVAENKTQYDYAQRRLQRFEKNLESNVVSEQEYDAAANDLAGAQAKLTYAEAALQQIKEKYRTDILTLEAEIEQAQAAIQSVEVEMAWCTLRSPLDGQVFAVHQRQGELTSGQPSSPVLALLDPGQLEVHLFVDESDFGRIQVGQTVRLRVESYPEKTMQGRITRLLPEPLLQENVVYYLAAVEVAGDERCLLRAEMTVLAHVEAGVHESVLLLPLGAARSRSDGWYVLEPGPDGPVEKPVAIGWNDGGRVEIREGLAEGDRVLLEP